MVEILKTADWQHSKKKAELIGGGASLIEMEFNRKATFVKIGKQELEIRKDGFWCPKIMIREKDKVIATQKQLGLWGTKSEFVLDEITYSAKTKQGLLFNISYSGLGHEILVYKLDALKSKPIITFEIKYFDLPEEHLLILLALGFYTIKNVALEAMSGDFIVAAVA